MKIGIPRALVYWKRPYFWETFFKKLGFEVLLSPQTNKEIVGLGVMIADPETCFSNKVYLGHLKWLEGRSDMVFVPRLKTNKEKLEYCPRFFALPDSVKILIKTPVLSEVFDERKEGFKKTLERLGRKLGKGRKEIRAASETALSEERERKKKEEEDFFRQVQSEKPKIVLVSHPYNLYDDYVNMGAREKLENLGVEVIFIDQVPIDKARPPRSNPKPHYWPKFHWEFAKEIMDQIDALLAYNIAGAIEISSFACGSDSVLKEFVEKRFKDNGIPFLYLIIDEQSGEAGFQTRLEAFVDTLKK